MTKPRAGRKLPQAKTWPKRMRAQQVAEFVASHDLSALIGRKPDKVESAPEVLKRTQEKRVERTLVALRLERRDLEQVRRIARERDIPYTALMRSWIREALRRARRNVG